MGPGARGCYDLAMCFTTGTNCLAELPRPSLQARGLIGDLPINQSSF